MDILWAPAVVFWTLLVVAGVVVEVVDLKLRRRSSAVVLPMPGRGRTGPVLPSPGDASHGLEDRPGARRGHLRAVGGTGLVRR